MTDDGLRIVCYGPKSGYRVDRLEDLLPNYDRVSVADVLTTPGEQQRLADWVKTFEDQDDTPFVVTSPLMGPLHLAARRSKNRVISSLLMAFVWLYCVAQTYRYGTRAAYVCSTFAWAAQRAARTVPLRVPLSAKAGDVLAYTNSNTTQDDKLARWLCGPTELWDAISPLDRWELDLTSYSTPTVDLTDPQPRSPQLRTPASRARQSVSPRAQFAAHKWVRQRAG